MIGGGAARPPELILVTMARMIRCDAASTGSAWSSKKSISSASSPVSLGSFFAFPSLAPSVACETEPRLQAQARVQARVQAHVEARTQCEERLCSRSVANGELNDA